MGKTWERKIMQLFHTQKKQYYDSTWDPMKSLKMLLKTILKSSIDNIILLLDPTSV